jgi:diacylglycerol O-acyltransferase / wax synthase
MAPKELNRRLTPLDASFLYFEKPNQPAHVGGCMVYEGYLSGEDLAKTVAARLHLLPRYRQKLVFPPFGLAHPTWEDDPDFDVRRHVDEIMLPAPADDRVLSEVGGQVYAGMLDRDHPLWKLIVLQGHRDGTSAVIWKIHHCMVDGVSGVDLTMVLHDLKAKGEVPAAPSVPWQPRPLPDPLTLMQDAVRDQLSDAATYWTEDSFQLLRPMAANDRARQVMNAVVSTMPTVMQPAPRMPFNGPLSPERRFAWAEFSFADIRFIRSALGGTINDVVLAVIAGAIGRYLRSHNLRTEGIEARAMCPVSMRRPEEHGALGNLVSMMFAPLYVGVLDPVERLAAERAAMNRLKDEDQAGGLYAMSQMLNRVPAAWQAAVGQLTVPNTMLNTVSTNVPGPQIPLFLAGRKLVGWYPLGLLASDIGLFNAILSYNQTLTIGATVDPKLMPDVWSYMSCLKESFTELRDAAVKAADERAAATPAEKLETAPA